MKKIILVLLILSLVNLCFSETLTKKQQKKYDLAYENYLSNRTISSFNKLLYALEDEQLISRNDVSSLYDYVSKIEQVTSVCDYPEYQKGYNGLYSQLDLIINDKRLTNPLQKEVIFLAQQIREELYNIEKDVFSKYDINDLHSLEDYLEDHPYSAFSSIAEEKILKNSKSIISINKKKSPYQSISELFWKSRILLRPNVIDTADDIFLEDIFLRNLSNNINIISADEKKFVYEISKEGKIYSVVFFFAQSAPSQVLIDKIEMRDSIKIESYQTFQEKTYIFNIIQNNLWQ